MNDNLNPLVVPTVDEESTLPEPAERGPLRNTHRHSRPPAYLKEPKGGHFLVTVCLLCTICSESVSHFAVVFGLIYHPRWGGM